MADANNLELQQQLGDVEVGTHTPSVGELSNKEEDDLKARLAALRA